MGRQNFGKITAAVKTVLGAISTAWNAVWNTLKAAFRMFVVDGILGPLGLIIDGAAKAFGWVPGLGGKLKAAAKAFDKFKANVNRSLGGINGRTVNVSVAMTSRDEPVPGRDLRPEGRRRADHRAGRPTRRPGRAVRPVERRVGDPRRLRRPVRPRRHGRGQRGPRVHRVRGRRRRRPRRQRTRLRGDQVDR